VNPRSTVAIAASYTFVASVAWTYGYICRVWLERRTREVDDLDSEPHYDLIDLVDRPPYDWQNEASGVADLFEWPGGITITTNYPPTPEGR
jgi:hypothetical protein